MTLSVPTKVIAEKLLNKTIMPTIAPIFPRIFDTDALFAELYLYILLYCCWAVGDDMVGVGGEELKRFWRGC